MGIVIIVGVLIGAWIDESMKRTPSLLNEPLTTPKPIVRAGDLMKAQQDRIAMLEGEVARLNEENAKLAAKANETPFR